jgi:hypothetical protein
MVRASGRRSAAIPAALPCLEVLEDRCVPALLGNPAGLVLDNNFDNNFRARIL